MADEKIPGAQTKIVEERYKLTEPQLALGTPIQPVGEHRLWTDNVLRRGLVNLLGVTDDRSVPIRGTSDGSLVVAIGAPYYGTLYYGTAGDSYATIWTATGTQVGVRIVAAAYDYPVEVNLYQYPKQGSMSAFAEVGQQLVLTGRFTRVNILNAWEGFNSRVQMAIHYVD